MQDIKNRSKWIIGEVIKREKLSNPKLAELLGVNKNTVNNYRNNSAPSAEFIGAFCKRFNVSATWWVTGDGEPWETETHTAPLAVETKATANGAAAATGAVTAASIPYLLKKTIDVLESGTGLAELLAESIAGCHAQLQIKSGGTIGAGNSQLDPQGGGGDGAQKKAG